MLEKELESTWSCDLNANKHGGYLPFSKVAAILNILRI